MSLLMALAVVVAIELDDTPITALLDLIGAIYSAPTVTVETWEA